MVRLGRQDCKPGYSPFLFGDSEAVLEMERCPQLILEQRKSLFP